ncbi:MAG: HAD family hydrolase [Clostridia bacterium]|nr:HAD family hydrolase [Clostridia bacterium]
MIKLIVFDMDGTLTDTTRLIPAYVNKTLEHFGGKALPAKTILSFVGFGGMDLLQKSLNEANMKMTAEEVFPYYDSLFHADPAYTVKPYEGVKEMLTALKEQGLRRIVFSNRPHHQTLMIIDATLDGYLDEVYGHREGYPKKPDPTVLNAIMEENNCTKEECLYVGDMQFDMDVAKNAGVRSVGCLWGIGGEEQVGCADFPIRRPLDILDVVNKLK